MEQGIIPNLTVEVLVEVAVEIAAEITTEVVVAIEAVTGQEDQVG